MRSTPEAKRQQLLDALSAARREVLAEAMAVQPGQQDTPFLGTWSAHDIVAHLIGWDCANREAIEAIRSGRLPAFYDRYDRDWRTFNAGLVAQYKQGTLQETVALAQSSHQALVAALAALPAREIGLDFGARSSSNRRVTISMLLGVETRDEHKHAQQIREFARRAGGEQAPTA